MARGNHLVQIDRVTLGNRAQVVGGIGDVFKRSRITAISVADAPIVCPKIGKANDKNASGIASTYMAG